MNLGLFRTMHFEGFTNGPVTRVNKEDGSQVVKSFFKKQVINFLILLGNAVDKLATMMAVVAVSGGRLWRGKHFAKNGFFTIGLGRPGNLLVGASKNFLLGRPRHFREVQRSVWI